MKVLAYWKNGSEIIEDDRTLNVRNTKILISENVGKCRNKLYIRNIKRKMIK